MQIRLRSVLIRGRERHAPGVLIDLPAAQAQRLIAQGRAVAFVAPPPPREAAPDDPLPLPTCLPDRQAEQAGIAVAAEDPVL